MDKVKKGICRNAEAYLTVEAALILPMVLGVVLLVIYLLFFQYDRCLMEQNVGKLAMRGCTFQLMDSKEIVARIVAQSRQTDERFLAWELGDIKVTIKGNRVRVERSGELEFPFKRFVFWQAESAWQSQIAYENYRIEPVQFIRNCRKIMGGK